MAWAPDYVSLVELRDYVRITAGADAVDDEQVQDAATGASRAVDGACGPRQFGSTAGAETRYYTPRWSKTKNAWGVVTDDIATSVGLVVRVDTALDATYATTVTKYLLRPMNAQPLGRPWEALFIAAPAGVRITGAADEVSVTANPFGWAAVPRTVKLAAKIQGARFLTRRESPYGVAGSPDQGNELRLLARVDPDVEVMLRNYRRRVWFR